MAVGRQGDATGGAGGSAPLSVYASRERGRAVHRISADIAKKRSVSHTV
jgi:hypothetical protein